MKWNIYICLYKCIPAYLLISEQLPDKTCHLPEPWHWAKTARETERHHQKASGVFFLFCFVKRLSIADWKVAQNLPACSQILKKICKSYGLYLLQGSVTEDKASSSHVVVPIPTSLEEGEASHVVFKHSLLFLLWTLRHVLCWYLFLFWVQRSGCVPWWREISKYCSTGDIFLTGWCSVYGDTNAIQHFTLNWKLLPRLIVEV